jgi:hypothetical protein
VISVYVDATVVISFAADVGNPTGMKFIDLREDWVLQLRNKKTMQALKIDTNRNPADFGTKILEPGEFKRQRDYFLHTPKTVYKQPKDQNMIMMTSLAGADFGKYLGGSPLFSALFTGKGQTAE